MNYYHNLVVEKSWQELQALQKTVEFILIGGWAIYLYTRALKSKDIDIIVDFDQLAKLEKHYGLNKNSRLKKYEARKDEVQIDIYLPYYSQIGIPVEELIPHTASLEGFTVLKPDYLLALKIYTLSRRGRTPKGRKDFIDSISLLNSNIISWDQFQKIIVRYKLAKTLNNFIDYLKEHFEIPELRLNKHHFAKLKKNLLTICGSLL